MFVWVSVRVFTYELLTQSAVVGFSDNNLSKCLYTTTYIECYWPVFLLAQENTSWCVAGVLYFRHALAPHYNHCWFGRVTIITFSANERVRWWGSAERAVRPRWLVRFVWVVCYRHELNFRTRAGCACGSPLNTHRRCVCVCVCCRCAIIITSSSHARHTCTVIWQCLHVLEYAYSMFYCNRLA